MMRGTRSFDRARLRAKGMVGFDHVLSESDAQAVQKYVVAATNATIALCKSEYRTNYPELLETACERATPTAAVPGVVAAVTRDVIQAVWKKRARRLLERVLRRPVGVGQADGDRNGPVIRQPAVEHLVAADRELRAHEHVVEGNLRPPGGIRRLHANRGLQVCVRERRVEEQRAQMAVHVTHHDHVRFRVDERSDVVQLPVARSLTKR